MTEANESSLCCFFCPSRNGKQDQPWWWGGGVRQGLLESYCVVIPFGSGIECGERSKESGIVGSNFGGFIEISSHELTARPVSQAVSPAMLSECVSSGWKRFQPALRFCWVSPTKESDTRELNLWKGVIIMLNHRMCWVKKHGREVAGINVTWRGQRTVSAGMLEDVSWEDGRWRLDN